MEDGVVKSIEILTGKFIAKNKFDLNEQGPTEVVSLQFSLQAM